jgi:hypothetical protein
MDWLAAYGISGNAAGAIYAVVILLGAITVILTVLRANSLLKTAAVSLLVEFALTPYALFYDYPSLVVTLFYANAQPLHRPLLIWGRVGLNVFAMTSLFIGDHIAYRYWIVIALGILLALTKFTGKPEPASELVPLHE